MRRIFWLVTEPLVAWHVRSQRDVVLPAGTLLTGLVHVGANVSAFCGPDLVLLSALAGDRLIPVGPKPACAA